MENYIRYLIKFFTILVLSIIVCLFIVMFINNNSKNSTPKKSNINIIDNEKEDNDEKKKTEEKKEETTTVDENSTSNNMTTSTNNTLNQTTTNNSVEEKTDTNINNSSVTNEESNSSITTKPVKENNETVDFSLNFNKKTLKVNETAKINVISNQNDLKIKYKSINSDVATVSTDGTIKALKIGTTYINVVVNENTAKIIELVIAKNDDNTIDNNQTNSTNNTNQANQSNNNQSNSKQETDTASNNNQSNNTSTKPSHSNQVNNNQNTTSKNQQKNGWYTINGKKYYYKNNVKVTNSYVNYIYLDSNGVAKAKVGSFSATLYGATAWANQNLNIREKATQNSKVLGTIPTGKKMTILSSENSNTKYIKIKYNGKIGYVYSDFILINLPDVIPDMLYEITAASRLTSKAADISIPGVTNKNLYGFSKKYNSKIGKQTYYAPLLYPTAKKLQKAYTKAKSEGYNLKVYDSYRPHDVTVYMNSQFRKLYESNSIVKKAIDYDKNGEYWGPSWFLAANVSAHNKGVALDIAITNSKNVELKAQTPFDTLDTRSVVKYNNSVSNKLRDIMLSQGFSPLKSEWWHFQDNNYYNSSPVNSFHLN